MITQHHDGTVEFAYFRPGAHQVTVAGDFNRWQSHVHQMTRDAEGWWRIRLALPSGEFRFKYVVDGSLWEADFAAYGVEMRKIGGWTSVLLVEPQRQVASTPAARAA